MQTALGSSVEEPVRLPGKLPDELKPTPISQPKPESCKCEEEDGTEKELFREGVAEHMIEFENAVQNVIFVR